ncbi:MAG: YbhB/YbcL family Raf kinase inhibitor-like protein [Patescibacteria group bacterium]|nr:YbhB/YbcL family Raf kinase inhibitor-like protein [Patescibacteria group bacterium]
MGNLLLKSSSFKQNETIPSKHTCDGDNVNPLLEIRNAPPETKSLVLIVDDPDATHGGVWDHWLVWNITPKTQYIDEDTVPAHAIQGKNSFGNQKYGGPCPPKGTGSHRYMFKLFALDTELDLKEGSTKTELEKAITGHILDQTVLTGLYSRK